MPVHHVDSPARSSRGYSEPDSLLPELHHVGWGTWREAEAGGFIHGQFADAYHFEYVLRGAAEWCVGDEVHEVPARSVTVFRPGERHGGFGAVMHPGEYAWAIVRLAPHGALPGLEVADSDALRAGLASIRCRSVPADAAVDAAFRRCFAEIDRVRDRFSVVVARAALHQFLIAVLRQAERAAAAPAPDRRLRAVLAWIDAHLDRQLAVEEVAEEAGLGARRLRDRFLAVLGCSPKQYILQRKLQRAKRLLRDDRDSVLDIAVALGFPSSQHFATTFKRATGLTPSAYRELASGAGMVDRRPRR